MACVKNKDRRKFMGGIYVNNKGAVKEERRAAFPL
jgi:hypothetical protein